MSLRKDWSYYTLTFLVGLSSGGVMVFYLTQSQIWKKRKKKKMEEEQKRSPHLDHVVIRSHGKTQECINFYNLLGFSVERYDEWKEAMTHNPPKSIFPHVRVNATQIIDLFPNNMVPHECPKQQGGNMDHFCLSVSGKEHLNMLNRLKNSKMDVKCVKQFEASGAQGIGWSTYFHDPTGLYIEIRNYEKEYWNEVKLFVESHLQ